MSVLCVLIFLALPAAAAVLETPRARIHYPSGFEADAARVGRAAGESFAFLDKEFAENDPAALLSGTSLEIRLTTQTTSMAGPGLATIVGPDDGRYVLHLWAPSLYTPADMGQSGERMDSDEYLRLRLTHELSSIYLEQLSAAKKAGWRIEGAPNWFRQGLEEDFGVSALPEPARAASSRRYLARHAQRPDGIRLGISVDRPYIDGQVFLRFLREVYGRQAVQRLLASREPTFARALHNSLGDDEAAIYKRFVAWREEAQASLPQPKAGPGLTFTVDASLRDGAGGLRNPNLERFIREFGTTGGHPVRLVDGGPGAKSSCSRTDAGLVCAIGRDSGMSEGLYRSMVSNIDRP